MSPRGIGLSLLCVSLIRTNLTDTSCSSILEPTFRLELKSPDYKTGILPLNYAGMVPSSGIEPLAPASSGQRSTGELRRRSMEPEKGIEPFPATYEAAWTPCPLRHGRRLTHRTVYKTAIDLSSVDCDYPLTAAPRMDSLAIYQTAIRYSPVVGLVTTLWTQGLAAVSVERLLLHRVICS